MRNTFLSVDPYMRGRMNDVKSYVPPFALDAPLDGGAVGEVVESAEDPSLQSGDTVLHQAGWREHALLPAAAVRKVDVDAGPRQRLPRRARDAGHDGVRRPHPDRAGQGGRHRLRLRRGRRRRLGRRPDRPQARRREGDRLGRLAGEGRVAGRRARLRRRLRLPRRPIRPSCSRRTDRSTSTSTTSAATTSRRRSSTWPTSAGSRPAARSPTTTPTAPCPGPRNLVMLVTKRLTLRGFIVSDHCDAAAEFFRRRRRLGRATARSATGRPSSRGSTARSTRSGPASAATTPGRCSSASERLGRFRRARRCSCGHDRTHRDPYPAHRRVHAPARRREPGGGRLPRGAREPRGDRRRRGAPGALRGQPEEQLPLRRDHGVREPGGLRDLQRQPRARRVRARPLGRRGDRLHRDRLRRLG